MVPHPQHKLEELLGTRPDARVQDERRNVGQDAIATLDACVERLESILKNWEVQR